MNASAAGSSGGGGGSGTETPEEFNGIVNGRWVHFKLARAAAVHEVRTRQAQRRRGAGSPNICVETVRGVLSSCEDVEVTELAGKLSFHSGTTLLLAAARLALPAATAVLLRHGADATLADATGCSPLSASRRGGEHLESATPAELAERRKLVATALRPHSRRSRGTGRAQSQTPPTPRERPGLDEGQEAGQQRGKRPKCNASQGSN